METRAFPWSFVDSPCTERLRGGAAHSFSSEESIWCKLLSDFTAQWGPEAGFENVTMHEYDAEIADPSVDGLFA